MARPVKLRTAATYQRDIEHLTRLRMAIRLDKVIPLKDRKKAFVQIDALTNTIVELIERVSK